MPRLGTGEAFARVVRIPTRHQLVGAAVIAGLCTTQLAAADPPKREVPDYDGRGNPDADAGSWVLWIPRVVLAPLWVANEFLLRRPLGWLVRRAERNHWAETVENLFTFGENNNNLLIPTALFDFGLLPSVGLYYAGEDFLTKNNQLRLHGATWGPKWINLTAADRYVFDQQQLEVRTEFKRSLDNLFFGTGPDVKSATQSRYGLERFEGSVSYRRNLGGESNFAVLGGIHRISFLDGDCCANPSLDTRIAEGDLMAPAGYRHDYTAPFLGAALVLDSRSPRPAPGSGAYLNLHGRASGDVNGDRAWLEYGAVLGASVDLTGQQRIIKMQLALDFVDALHGGRDDIPFTEYPTLTSAFMPGFVTGWMTGLSTVAAQIGYTWPIWIGLDGQTRFAVGNAFGPHLGGLSAQKLRFSYDFGFTTSANRDQGFEILFGLGTETLDNGADITSVRLTFGTRKGF